MSFKSISVGAVGALALVLGVGTPGAKAQETPKAPAPLDGLLPKPSGAAQPAVGSDTTGSNAPITQIMLTAGPIEGKPGVFRLMVTRATDFQTVIKVVSALDGGRAVFDDHLFKIVVPPTVRPIEGTVEEIIQQVVRSGSGFLILSWGQAGKVRFFMTDLSLLGWPLVAPRATPPQGSGFNANRGPLPKLPADVPPGTKWFEFNGERVYHVPIQKLDAQQKVETPPVAPAPKPNAPMTHAGVPNILAPAEELTTLVPMSSSGERAEDDNHAWGSVTRVAGTPLVKLVIRAKLTPLRDVLSALCAHEGTTALFDDSWPPIFVGRQTLAGRPDGVIHALLNSTPIVGGQAGRERFFGLSNSELARFVLSRPSQGETQTPAPLKPDAPSFEFNGGRVYHVPVVPEMKTPEAQRQDEPAPVVPLYGPKADAF